jgi:hypothetical protein
MSKRANVAVLVAGVLVVGVAGAQQGRWTRADYELADARTVEKSGLQDLSAKIFLVSDNQRHELLGSGVEIFRTAIADRKAKVAIRPPQLDLFGQDLLVEALAMTDGFVLHLGDACDISNTGEFGSFAWDMRVAPLGWIMAPGNHDGYFFGNSSRTIPKLIQEWNDAAETYTYDGATIDSRAMQKDRYVSYYLAALILQDAVWSAPLARTLGPGVERRYSEWRNAGGGSGAATAPRTFAQYWQQLLGLQDDIYQSAGSVAGQAYHSFELPPDLAPRGRPHLRRVAWHIDKDRVWRSFILQELEISAAPAANSGNAGAVSILVLDTGHYQIQPSLDHGLVSLGPATLSKGYFDFQVAGEVGAVFDTQEAAARQFMQSMEQEGRIWMLASHHPYKDLARRTKPRFDGMREAGAVPVTLSAHTHTGEVIWNEDGKREGSWLEINVGSLLDTPVEFRDLQVHRLGDRIAITSHRWPLEDLLREKGLIADGVEGYRPVSSDPDYYLAYKSGILGDSKEADFRVKRILLAAYLRMLRLFEADDPDQRATRWPTGPDGVQLRSHAEVTDAAGKLLAGAGVEQAGELTQFLYQLREFDRTRRFTDAAGERMRVYRLSQAIWAGRDEYTTWPAWTPGMDPDISFFVLPASPAVTERMGPNMNVLKAASIAASAVAAAALSSGGVADPAADPAVAYTMVRHPVSGALLPRISLDHRPEVEQKVNGTLESLAAELMCEDAPPDSTFDSTATVTYAAGDVFSVRVVYSAYCGGAYPTNYANASVTFDLRTGQTVAFEQLFEDHKRDFADIARTFLKTLSPKDIEGCDDVLTIDALAEYGFAYAVSAKGLRMETVFPHVIAACDREATVPFDELRAFAAPEGILKRMGTAATGP